MQEAYDEHVQGMYNASMDKLVEELVETHGKEEAFKMLKNPEIQQRIDVEMKDVIESGGKPFERTREDFEESQISDDELEDVEDMLDDTEREEE